MHLPPSRALARRCQRCSFGNQRKSPIVPGIKRGSAVRAQCMQLIIDHTLAPSSLAYKLRSACNVSLTTPLHQHHLLTKIEVSCSTQQHN